MKLGQIIGHADEIPRNFGKTPETVGIPANSRLLEENPEKLCDSFDAEMKIFIKCIPA